MRAGVDGEIEVVSPISSSNEVVSPISSSNEKRKKVKFDTAVKVVLIPTVEEYRKAELGNLLWWDAADYIAFKESALEELRHYIFHHPLMNTKEAIFELYQKGLCEVSSAWSPSSESKNASSATR